MKILAIDTSNQTLAVALCEDQKLLGQIQTTINKNHSTTLMPAIEFLMQQLKIVPSELKRIVVAKGPGSYTGLRIGVTTAKTLAYTLDCELVGISSLKTLAANCVDRKELIIPLFDARRNNVYAAVYQWQNGVLQTVMADCHIAFDQLMNQFKDQEVFFVGEDVQKFKEQIINGMPNATINTWEAWQYPQASQLAQLGSLLEQSEEIHSFLPSYLKRVEAEEKWLLTHKDEAETNYVEKI